MSVSDITIVGGGLAGATLALALRDYPVHVTVLDASPLLVAGDSQADMRHIALSDLSRRIFEALNVWQTLAERAMPIRNIQVSEQGTFGVTRICAEEEGLEALAWVVPYHALLHTLQEQLQQAFNVSFIAPAKVESLHVDEQGASIHINRAGEKETLQTNWMVLADGGSQLQKMAGFELCSSNYQQTAIVTTIETECAIGDTAYERFTDQGPLAVLPASEGRCGVTWMQATRSVQKVMAMDDSAFSARLQADFGRRLGNITKPGKRAAYPLRHTYTTELVNRRAVVIGNAAHTLHPVAAQGFNLTLRDIAELAETIFAAPNLDEADWSGWANGRLEDIQRVIRFTNFLAADEKAPLSAGIRARGLLLLDLCPPLRRLIVRQSLGLSAPTSRLASGQHPHCHPALDAGSSQKIVRRTH